MLQVTPYPLGCSGELYLRSSALVGNVLEFRSCEGLLSESRDFGLFKARLGITDWEETLNSWGYTFVYSGIARVQFLATLQGDQLSLEYQVSNLSTSTLPRVQVHPCLPTLHAPAFWAEADKNVTPQTFEDRRFGRRTCPSTHRELLTRLFFFSRDLTLPFANLSSATHEVHLALMKRGIPEIAWAWWNNDSEVFDVPFVALKSKDGKYTLGYGFESGIWASANVGDERACFHLFPYFGDLAPGQSSRVRGALYLTREPPQETQKRFSAQFLPR